MIYDMGQTNIANAFNLGIELGYFFQFGVFSYIMIGIMNQSTKQRIKDHLSKVSSILQYMSFETVETMLYQMKTLNLGRLKKEFLMLTAFHGHKFCDEIATLEGVEPHIKEGFTKLVTEFMAELFELAEMDNEALAAELGGNTAFFNSVREAQKAAAE